MDDISYNIIYEATAFHFDKHASPLLARRFTTTILKKYINFDVYLQNAHYAKRPFQFLANMRAIANRKPEVLNKIPITQDASASAYQIMSYFLLDETMAKRTNLIASSDDSDDDEIQDVYAFMLEELKEYLKAVLDNSLSNVVCEHLTRDVVKGIFMPKIYGKTLMSTAEDLKDILSQYITNKECYVVASACFKFWKDYYPGMECLIRNIGWIASAVDRPVLYNVPYFTTVQDYMIMDAINIWVYDTLSKKRRKVTLRVASSKRDRRKTEISTFVNFIHQKDAYIAMNVVEEVAISLGLPLYTVHDNFISTPFTSKLIATNSRNAIRNMGPPLSIINKFIYMNVRKRSPTGVSSPIFLNHVIPNDYLRFILNETIPKNINKKMRETWEERISSILTSYEVYTRTVCGDSISSKALSKALMGKEPSPGFMKKKWTAHEERWDDFKKKMHHSKYCVHY